MIEQLNFNKREQKSSKQTKMKSFSELFFAVEFLSKTFFSEFNLFRIKTNELIKGKGQTFV